MPSDQDDVNGQVPPNDLDAEQAVLGTLLVFPERLGETEGLLPEHCYDARNGAILAAIRSVAAVSGSWDPPAVRAWLADHGRLDRAGGPAYLGQLIGDAPFVQQLAAQAERIRARAEVRGLIAACQRTAAEGYQADSPADLRRRLGELLGPTVPAIGDKPGPQLAWQQAPAIAEPLPDLKWAVRGLQIGPGRPAMVTAYAGTAKTVALQSLALSYANGSDVWGQFSTAGGGAVKHLDYEQGSYATRRRYQRLAFGHGLELAELGDRLQFVSFPALYLTDSEAVWERELDGAGLVIVDSLRAAAPGVDENSSDIRQCVDLLTRTSERTGAAIIIVHHAGKTRDGHVDPRQIARGSSALLDAVGCSYVLTMTTMAEPRKVQQVKLPAETDGSTVDTGYLAVEDVEGPSGPRHGLRIMWQDAEQVQVKQTPARTLQSAEERVASAVRATAQGLSKRRLRALVGGRHAIFEAALEACVDDGRVVSEKRTAGRGGGHLYRAGRWGDARGDLA